jgi:hypothetical protein
MNIFNFIIATFFGLLIISIYLIYSIIRDLLKLIEKLFEEK